MIAAPAQQAENALARQLIAAVARGSGDPEVRQRAVLHALEHGQAHPEATADELSEIAETYARNAARSDRRRIQRVTTSAAAVEVATAGAFQGARDLLKPAADKAAELCGRLAAYQRHLGSLIASGALFRRPELERSTYRRGAALIAETLDIELSSARARCIVDRLVAFRVRFISIRCEVCCSHPSALWTECAHTQGVDLRGRGPRVIRPRRYAAHNGGPAVDQSGKQRLEDAAGRLVTELLSLSNVDPHVRHVESKRRERARAKRFADYERSRL
jgi:hypothetical protein